MSISTVYDSPIVAHISNRSRDPLNGRLSLLDVETQRFVRSFPVVCEGSGFNKRCAPSRDTRQWFVGCYETHGLAAYSTAEGAELWRREDLHQPQYVVSFPCDDFIFCRCELAKGFLLSVSTGSNLEVLSGIKEVYPSPFGSAAVVGAGSLELHEPFGRLRGKMPRTTFAVLACAFSDTEVAISESTGSLRCFNISSAELTWTHTPKAGSHFVSVSFSKSLACFVGILWDFEQGRDGLGLRLLHLDRQTGATIRDIPLDTTSLCHFCLAGTRILTEDLHVMSVETGGCIHQFTETTQHLEHEA